MTSFAPKRILVPVCGYSTDEEAVSFGCRISKRENAKVRVITVLEVDRRRQLGETKEEDLEKAEKFLAAAEEAAAGHHRGATLRHRLANSKARPRKSCHSLTTRFSTLGFSATFRPSNNRRRSCIRSGGTVGSNSSGALKPGIAG